jgi:oligopeptidase A
MIEAMERLSLDETEKSLRAMRKRLSTILDRHSLSADDLVELTVIFDNVSYVFLYLEANGDYIAGDRLAPLRLYFQDNPELEGALMAQVQALTCEGVAERARLRLLEHLKKRATRRSADDEAAFAGCESLLQNAQTELRSSRQALLERLGVTVSAGEAVPAYLSLLGRIERNDTRLKLWQAWQAISERHIPQLQEPVDTIATLRNDRARQAGHDHALAATLVRTQVSKETVEAFVDSCLAGALKDQEAIEKILAGENRPPPVKAHFRRHLHDLSDGRSLPQFPLVGTLSLLERICHAVFGLEFQQSAPEDSSVLKIDVFRRGLPVGCITVDLWDIGNSAERMNRTLCLRNRSEWGGFRQLPQAHVACRFSAGAKASHLLTFQNLHSLFHEFGHAVNHLLIRERIPNLSGLEYLPLERLEYLSMWFEQWVYHREFAAAFDGIDPQAVETCRKIRRLEYRHALLERAVVAWLDLRMHSCPAPRLSEMLAELEHRHGISRHVDPAQLPDYFTLPMTRHNPGANFIYLWGTAWSCAIFAPLRETPLAELDGPALQPVFAPCFEPLRPAGVPSPDFFGFYR